MDSIAGAISTVAFHHFVYGTWYVVCDNYYTTLHQVSQSVFYPFRFTRAFKTRSNSFLVVCYRSEHLTSIIL